MNKGKYLQWRATDSEREMAKQLADDYGVSVSELFRFALEFLNEKKPPLTMTITKVSSRKAEVAPPTTPARRRKAE